MKIAAIVATDINRAIGKNNDLPWRLPADFRFFIKTTTGYPIIMGRKNYESIGHPLPKRTNIVVTRNTSYRAKGCEVVHSIEKAINLAKGLNTEWIFIIGGAEIYKQTQVIWDRLYWTKIDLAVEKADSFFPEIDLKNWKLLEKKARQRDEENPYDYTFLTYERIQP